MSVTEMSATVPPKPAPIGQYFTYLAKLLEEHPAPWKLDCSSRLEAQVLDAREAVVVGYDPDDGGGAVFWPGAVGPGNLDAVTVEHVVPKARGGAGRDRNTALAHQRCNLAKADRAPRPCELLYLAALNLMLAWAAA